MSTLSKPGSATRYHPALSDSATLCLPGSASLARWLCKLTFARGNPQKQGKQNVGIGPVKRPFFCMGIQLVFLTKMNSHGHGVTHAKAKSSRQKSRGTTAHTHTNTHSWQPKVSGWDRLGQGSSRSCQAWAKQTLPASQTNDLEDMAMLWVSSDGGKIMRPGSLNIWDN